MKEQIEQKPSVDERLQAHIGRHLRAMYNQIANETVPDKLLDLVDQLDELDSKEKRG